MFIQGQRRYRPIFTNREGKNVLVRISWAIGRMTVTRVLTVFFVTALCIRFVNSLVFYGLSLSATRIGGNDYINFFISGAVEVPANLACLVTLERFGRTKPLALSMSLAGLVLLTVVLVPNGLSTSCCIL